LIDSTLRFKVINLIFKLVMTVHANSSKQLDADKNSVTNVRIVRTLDPNILKTSFYNFSRLINTNKLADRLGMQIKYINCYDIYTVSSTREVMLASDYLCFRDS